MHKERTIASVNACRECLVPENVWHVFRLNVGRTHSHARSHALTINNMPLAENNAHACDAVDMSEHMC